MPYVKRGPGGEIVAVYTQAENGADEFVDPENAQLHSFLETAGVKDRVRKDLVQSDLEMSRVVEDLVDAMIRKNQLMLTDLPSQAQEKLMKRQNLRGQLNGLVGLIGDDDIL